MTKYGVPSKINGKRNPAYWRAYNKSESAKGCRARSYKKRNRGLKCAYCDSRAQGLPTQNGQILHGPKHSGKAMFICRDCCPEGRLTKPLSPKPRAIIFDPITFHRSLRSARNVPAEPQQPPISILALMRGFEKLAARESEVLVMRFWREMTLDEVGSNFAVGKERIRQIEANALSRLRKYFRHEDVFLTP
jgi:RNA polymerase sigma factor (sigma-70 family)